MALNLDSSIQNWRVLVEIQLDGLTVRRAQDYLVQSDGTVWEKGLVSTSPLRMSAGRMLDPQIVTSSMAIELDNVDNVITDLMDDYEWGSRLVLVYVGQGTAAADYAEVWRGRVRISGGIEYDDVICRIDLMDVRGADAQVLPPNKLFPSDYPNIEDKSKYLPIPIIYGDWSSGVAGGERVPSYCVDTTAGVAGRFKLAAHELKQIEKVFLNSVDITTDCTMDLANAEFTITGAQVYAPLTDTVSANVQGATDDGTSSGTLLQTLPEIADDLLQTWLGVDAADIDATQFAVWAADLTTSDYGRRWIGSEISSNTLMSEIAVDGLIDWLINDGQYYPVPRLVSMGTFDTYRSPDILSGADQVKMFRVSKDPEEIYLNQIKTRYAYDPVADTWTQYTKDDDAAIAQIGARKRRRVDLNWLYLQAGAEARGQRELYFYSTELEMLQATFGPRALTKSPTDLFRMVYSKFTEQGGVGHPFQVRDITPHFTAMKAEVSAWNVANLVPARWTADTIPTWLLSSAAERRENGYWTDASGYADTTSPPDDTSQRSRWI